MRTLKRTYPNLKAFLDDLAETGVTQAEFAERLGMSAAHLSEIKKGKAKPSLGMAKRLADECGVPIESFIG